MTPDVTYRICDWRKGLASLEDGSIDLLMLDPPFGGITDNAWDHAPDWAVLRDEAARVLARTGTLYMFGRQPTLIPVHNAFASRFVLQAEYIWDKGSGLWHEGKKPRNAHENVWWYRKADARPVDIVFNLEEAGLRNPVVLKAKRAGTISSSGNQRNTIPRMYETRPLNPPSSVLRFSRVVGGSKEYRGHPTQKPIALIAWLIRAATLPGALVVDPFLGSGTALYPCAATGRRGIGFERNRRWSGAIQAALSWTPTPGREGPPAARTPTARPKTPGSDEGAVRATGAT